MSDKSNRSSRFLLLFLFAFSCGPKIPAVNTEIICPNGSRILVKYANAKEVRDAAQWAYKEKKRLRTSEGHTVIRLPKTRSFKIEKIPPEEIIKCQFVERPMGSVDLQYIHRFEGTN